MPLPPLEHNRDHLRQVRRDGGPPHGHDAHARGITTSLARLRANKAAAEARDLLRLVYGWFVASRRCTTALPGPVFHRQDRVSFA